LGKNKTKKKKTRKNYILDNERKITNITDLLLFQNESSIMIYKKNKKATTRKIKINS
jgi:hypothetical protein